MKGCEIILDTWDDRKIAVRFIDGQLDDLILDAKDDVPRPGTIFRATCDRPVKGQGGMFVKLGDGRMGFIRQAKGLSPGTSLLVQVTGYAEHGKAVPVTPRVIHKSRYCILTPGARGINVARSIKDDALRDRLLEIAHDLVDATQDTGVILRSSTAQASVEDIEEDLRATWDLASAISGDQGNGVERLLDGPDAHDLAWRDWSEPHPDAVYHNDHGRDLAEILDDALSIEVDLRPGSASIEPTRALVAVDVNTRADTSPAAGTKANMALAQHLPRALRVRGLGGQIVLDLAPMAKKDRRPFETALRRAFRTDPIETSLVGWTPLGHFELSRKRERRPLGEIR